MNEARKNLSENVVMIKDCNSEQEPSIAFFVLCIAIVGGITVLLPFIMV